METDNMKQASNGSMEYFYKRLDRRLQYWNDRYHGQHEDAFSTRSRGSSLAKSGEVAELVREFVASTASSGNAVKYRADVQHFLSWCNKSGVDATSATLTSIQDFAKHDCGLSCGPRYRSKSINSLPVIARFLYYVRCHVGLLAHEWPELDARLEEFRSALIYEGVSPRTAMTTLLSAVHLVVWSALEGESRQSINKQTLKLFAAHQCFCGLDCRRKPPSQEVRNRRLLAAMRFLRFLSKRSVLHEKGVPISTRDRMTLSPVLLEYRGWLIEQRGLRPSTVGSYTLELSRWLPRFGEDPTTYSAASIRDLASHELARRALGTQGKFITSLRSYLQFCVSKGRISSSLERAVVSRRSYSLSSIPRRIEVADVAEVIARVNLDTPVGLRDRAILLLLAELGLRAAEVASIRLADLDWTQASIRIAGKGGRGAIVPMTLRGGDAMQKYIAQARPQSTSDIIFLRARAPHVPLRGGAEISNIARKALARCGHCGGAHVFRHSLATALLRSGRTIEDVATVLRHRSVQTTTIYAKVNTPMLQRLALPWIGDDQ